MKRLFDTVSTFQIRNSKLFQCLTSTRQKSHDHPEWSFVTHYQRGVVLVWIADVLCILPQYLQFSQFKKDQFSFALLGKTTMINALKQEKFSSWCQIYFTLTNAMLGISPADVAMFLVYMAISLFIFFLNLNWLCYDLSVCLCLTCCWFLWLLALRLSSLWSSTDISETMHIYCTCFIVKYSWFL